LVLAIVSSMARGKINLLEIALTAAMAIGFTFVVAKFGTRAMETFVPGIQQTLSVGEAQFALAMVLLFGFSALAVYAGVAAIVGAFLAGMALAESVQPRVHVLTDGVSELLVPFFLAGIGLHFDVRAFGNRPTLELSGIILAAAVISKLAGCGLGAIRFGGANALRVGLGMIPRGEVGMVVAQIGLGMRIIPPDIYAVVVIMSVATTVVAPPALKAAYKGVAARAPDHQESPIG
jgi:Kef-type K+ transport system membrane component KefB